MTKRINSIFRDVFPKNFTACDLTHSICANEPTTCYSLEVTKIPLFVACGTKSDDTSIGVRHDRSQIVIIETTVGFIPYQTAIYVPFRDPEIRAPMIKRDVSIGGKSSCSQEES